MPHIEDGTFSTGISVKNIHNIFLTESFKSQTIVLQTLGRGLRTHKDKKLLNVIDFVDNLSYDSDYGYKYVNFFVKHSKERIKIYKEQNFPFEIKNVNI